MTFYHGTAARFYYHTLDMSGYVEQVEQQLRRALAEYRPLNATAVQRYPGRRDVSIALTGGALDPAAGANDEFVFDMLDNGTIGAFAFLPYGDAHGRACYCGLSLGDNQQRRAGDDVIRLPVALVGTQYIDRAIILRALALGGTSPGSSYDGTAQSSDGGAGCLICTAISGASAELIVTIEDSPDNSEWSTLLTMTALTAVGSEIKVVTGTVEQYLRVSWVLTGTTPSATWFAAFARR